MTHPHLEVRKSNLPNAGDGLFTMRDHREGDVICEYTGKVLTLLQAMRAPDKSYMMGTSLLLSIYIPKLQADSE